MRWLKENWPDTVLFFWIWLVTFAAILLLTGCCLFRHTPTALPVPEVQTITNTIIKQVKVNDWLVTGSVLLMGVGVFGFLNGWKQGMSLVGAAAAVLGISLILKAYGAILVFAGAVCIAGYVGWQIYIRVKGLEKVVQGGEMFKKILPALVQDKLILKTLTPSPYQWVPRVPTDEVANIIAEGFNAAHGAIQDKTPAIKALVAEIREKINGNQPDNN